MTTTTNATPRRIIRMPEVQALTGFSRSGIYKLISEGRFPKQKVLNVRSVGWDSMEIQQWINDRLNGENAA